ncbi:GNAT family N-acetyltransferase [Myroides sp. LoEW2-1]|uniref:GNAT family N-acetyltransferase n=1 Tax=Myroides sp. LoEW2-1 TaxID=2683192 RepID=UPI0013268660|nr:GNAT family N-acetyltransferase [Myroides sp. LoEW2-1]MVX36783.1 GNAT family N-acetyltransferase [Myroides sp. LoEW2-1]
MEIKHTALESKGVFTAFIDGKKAGEMTYSVAGTDKIIVDHTGVEEGYNGLGVGKKLVIDGVVPYARENGLKVIPLCPFAKSVFDKNESLRDVLA